jgi:23S rRNA (pseudouridine1915-N3)-methyltransferase
MKIKLLLIGKTDQSYLEEGVDIYSKRIMSYVPFEIITANVSKKWNSLPPPKRKEKEAQIILEYIANSDFAVLLDEHGKQLTSVSFANFIQERMNRSTKNLLFIVGGPFGFSKDVYNSAQMKLSLSSMTFSHQMVRLFFTEQLYRAFTIIRNEGYHNE